MRLAKIRWGMQICRECKWLLYRAASWSGGVTFTVWRQEVVPTNDAARELKLKFHTSSATWKTKESSYLENST